jgi:hypothetical protein
MLTTEEIKSARSLRETGKAYSSQNTHYTTSLCHFFKHISKLSLHRLERRIDLNMTLNLASFSKCRDTRFQPQGSTPTVGDGVG